MHHKVKGIVIREKAQGESSKLLTVITELDGVITVKAKGARSISASNLKSVQLFAFSNMLLYYKNGFYTLVDAELIEDFYGVREKIESFALASYCCEVAGSVATKDSENGNNLQLLLNTLYVLTKDIIRIKQVKAVFEFRLAVILGFEPDIAGCDSCGNKLTALPKFLDAENGVFLCGLCAVESPQLMPVSQSCYDALKYIISAKSNKIFSFSLSDNALDELNGITEMYLHIRLEKKYKTLDFLKQLL